MVNYRYVGQYIRTTSGCGGCGTKRQTVTLNTNVPASITISSRNFIAQPNMVYSFTPDEEVQLIQWTNDKVYEWLKI